MPRRAYIAELNGLTKSVSIPGILRIRPGDDDGEFKVTVSPDGGASRFVISGLIPDLSEYPSGHSYHLFVDDDAPANVGKTLEKMPDMSGHDLSDLLRFLSKAFLKVDGEGDAMMIDSQELDGTYDDFEAEVEDEEDDIFSLDRPAVKLQPTAGRPSSRPSGFSCEQVKADLRLAHDAGFKVGYHGTLLDGGNCYVSISCRVSKLGISEEALQAWELNGNEYLVLLIHYPAGYKTLDQLMPLDPFTARSYASFRIGVMKDGKTYKPSLNETVRAFVKPSTGEEIQSSESPKQTNLPSSVDGWRDVFISKPLNVLFNERFLNILKYHYKGMPWQGAERFYNDVQGKNYDIDTFDYLDPEYTDVEVSNKIFPPIVMADHLKDAPAGSSHSLPLLAMQFLLRHFVRCTDFCLVCHCKLDDDLEAIKPYVCNKELCLFQYMNLGFGPSIEHEIISQPYVVDLLVSFCYTSAVGNRLQEFPSGLGLHVPPPSLNQRPPVAGYNFNNINAAQPNANNNKDKDVPKDPKAIEARYDDERNELIFPKGIKCPLRVGKWIALKYIAGDETEKDPQTYHGRVLETNYWPIVKLSGLRPHWPKQESTESDGNANDQAKAKTPELKKVLRSVYIWNYDVDFDTLQPHEKTSTILALLERIPPVKEMREYLLSYKNASLDRWKDRMPDSCLQVLRWVIASNRACIVQVDNPDDADGSKRSEERLYGMKGWMQFRFAMGAPDKERRFLDAVQETAQRLTLKYPTIFAWHGSPMQNWHSIIREGLHFRDTLHGRAYGHGVYFSTDFNVSQGYSQHGPRCIPSNCWPNSELKVSNAMSLNEIVNAPAEFVSQQPYLVVSQLDWIQTRYLFVKVNNEDWKMDEMKESKPSDVFVQDPTRRPVGASDKVEIPITAVSRSRRGKVSSVPKVDGDSKKKLKYSGNQNDPICIDDDDTLSVMTEPEDRAILEVEEPPSATATSRLSDVFSFGGLGNKKGKQSLMDGVRSFISGSKHSLTPVPVPVPIKPLTDFVPGQLDYSSLPILPPPPFATPSASKRLQKDYQTLLKVQNSTPPHELGWYTDPERFGDNVYQWIVELHSFDEGLPLARQMKERGERSIVLEMRFGAAYPMEPPFVRVVRPRFLAFQQGGGGHVTAGGSICMELLTNSGWSAASSIESVLLQVRMAISSRDPKPAQLESISRGGRAGYGVGEAINAYIRACNVHGWRVPQGFKEMALGGEAAGGKGYY